MQINFNLVFIFLLTDLDCDMFYQKKSAKMILALLDEFPLVVLRTR